MTSNNEQVQEFLQRAASEEYSEDVLACMSSGDYSEDILDRVTFKEFDKCILARIIRLRHTNFKNKKLHIIELQKIAKDCGFSFNGEEGEKAWWDAMEKLLTRESMSSPLSPEDTKAVDGMKKIRQIAPDWVDKDLYPRRFINEELPPPEQGGWNQTLI